LARSDDVDLWAMDEVHFQQYGSRCRMWIPPETKDPVLLHHPTRKSVGYFGAVRLRDGKLIYSRETGRFNAQTCFTFLQKLWALSMHSNRRVVVILDNARYHHATLHKEWREAAAPWFKLEYLPAYSPDLNPIERVWKLTRRIATHNRYFPILEDIIAAVEHTFEPWQKGSNTLRRLCAIT
jgi:transposase